MEGGNSFAIETTLATRSYKNLVKRAQQKGYTVVLLFFWLESPEMACDRVAKRVSEGGHNIPTELIYQRYYSGLKNLFGIYMPIVDYWALYDNNFEAKLIAKNNQIINLDLFNRIKESV